MATLFPNEASLLRLVSAILSETSEDWETGKAYLSDANDRVNERNTERSSGGPGGRQ